MEKFLNKYLPCTIDKGMFSNEYSVEIVLENAKYSLFVDSKNIKNGNGNEGLLFVNLIDSVGQFGTIVLPSETLNGFSSIQVPLNILEEA